MSVMTPGNKNKAPANKFFALPRMTDARLPPWVIILISFDTMPSCQRPKMDRSEMDTSS